MPCHVHAWGQSPGGRERLGGVLHDVSSTSLLSTVSAVSQLCRDDNKD